MADSLNELAQLLQESAHRKVYAYLRVSSTKQEQGLSLEAQRGLIEEYCRKQNLAEPLFVTETSSAGKRMFPLPTLSQDEATEECEARPKLLMLLGHVTSLKDTHLVVWRVDRLSRIGDEREIIYQLLVRSSVSLHSTDASEQNYLSTGNSGDPMTTMVRQIFAIFSQYERAMTEVRTKTGMRFKALRGEFTGGAVPYGYRIEERDLAIDPQRSKMVRYVFMLRYSFNLTIRGIAQRITEYLPAGQTFSRMRVSRILKHEKLYRGWYTDRYGVVHARPDLRILDEGDDHDYQEEFGGG